jgi:hypothetical protein
VHLPIPYKITYDTNKFKFKELICDILEIDFDLQKLHIQKQYDKLSRENDQSTVWHKKYYDNFKTKFYATFIIQKKFLIQKKFSKKKVLVGTLLNNLNLKTWHLMDG